MKRKIMGSSKKRRKEASPADLVAAADHCDDYIDDAAPPALRKFLEFARAPAHGAFLPQPHPQLYADYEGKRVRVTMASRLGDVGITTDFTRDMGYDRRVPVSQLSNFSDQP